MLPDHKFALEMAGAEKFARVDVDAGPRCGAVALPSTRSGQLLMSSGKFPRCGLYFVESDATVSAMDTPAPAWHKASDVMSF